MKRKFLYAVALLLCLSTVALSNERGRLWCGLTGKTSPETAASRDASACDAAAHDATAHDATASEEKNGSANHMFLRTFIKLLYI
jgi:hypothetical protein